MWANAQRDGRSAGHSWRPLFNAAKFGSRSLLECRAVTLTRRQKPFKFAPNYRTDLSRQWAEVHHIVTTYGGDIAL